MQDRECSVASFAASIDILCCNRSEWETLEDRESAAWQVSILAVTDGPAGSTVRYTTPSGDSGRLHLPAFPRGRPPLDTNRAGEAYAATLISTLLDHDWRAATGVVEESLMQVAAERAAAAAALVLDRALFGFPTPAEIDRALQEGSVY